MYCFDWILTIHVLFWLDFNYPTYWDMIDTEWWLGTTVDCFFCSERGWYYPLLAMNWIHQSWESGSERIIGFEHCSFVPRHPIEIFHSEVQLAGAFPTSTTTRIWMHVSLLQSANEMCFKVKLRRKKYPARGPWFTGKLQIISYYKYQ